MLSKQLFSLAWIYMWVLVVRDCEGVESGQAVLHFAKRVYIISRIYRTHKIVPAISESGMIDPWPCKASHVNIAFHRANNGVVSCNEGLRHRKSLLGAAEGYGRKRLLTRLPERTTPQSFVFPRHRLFGIRDLLFFRHQICFWQPKRFTITKNLWNTRRSIEE